MSKVSKICLSLIAALLVTGYVAHAQSASEIDTRLASYLDKIGYWGGYYPENPAISREDSLSNANNELADYLKKVGTKNPSTIKGHSLKQRKVG